MEATIEKTWKPLLYMSYVKKHGVRPETVREICELLLQGVELPHKLKRLVVKVDGVEEKICLTDEEREEVEKLLEEVETRAA